MLCKATFRLSWVFLFFSFPIFFQFYSFQLEETQLKPTFGKFILQLSGLLCQVLISFLNSCLLPACLTAGYFPSGLGRFSTELPFASMLNLEHIDGWQVNIWNWFHMKRSTEHAPFRSSAFLRQMRSILLVYARQTLYVWRYVQSNAFDILKVTNGMWSNLKNCIYFFQFLRKTKWKAVYSYGA